MVFFALAVTANIRAPDHHDLVAYLLSCPLVLLTALLVASPLAGVCKISRTARAFAVECPAGAVLSSEFGAYGFTLRIPRGVLRDEYNELLGVTVGRRAVALRLRHQPQQAIARPRELFPESALALIAPHTEGKRRS